MSGTSRSNSGTDVRNRQRLADFAAAYKAPTGMKCWLCGIPERAEIDAQIMAGVGPAPIQQWLLRVCGYPKDEATRNRVENHRRAHCLDGRKISKPE